ncbi:MAG: hypothetical protein Q9Q13_02225 [Acidobacteriota bacterium]|nr:hypothetical protein [Acidobacteriota bacterium]
MSSSAARFPLDDARRVIAAALDEDLGTGGDITSEAVFPQGRDVSARLVAREEVVVAGLAVCSLVYQELAARSGRRAVVETLLDDGARAAAGGPWPGSAATPARSLPVSA